MDEAHVSAEVLVFLGFSELVGVEAKVEDISRRADQSRTLVNDHAHLILPQLGDFPNCLLAIVARNELR